MTDIILENITSINDVNKVVEIIKAYHEFYEAEKKEEKEIYNFIFDRINNNQSKIFIAVENNKVVGFIQLYSSYSTVSLKSQWVLNDLYVLKEYRLKGIATSLMNSVKSYFKDQTKGFILVTDKTNKTAQKFYDDNDFKTGEYEFYTFFY